MNMLPAEVLDRFPDLPATYAFHDVRSVWILCIEELNHVGDQMPCTAGNNRSSKRSKFALAKYFKVVEMAGFYWPQRTQQSDTCYQKKQNDAPCITLPSPRHEVSSIFITRLAAVFHCLQACSLMECKGSSGRQPGTSRLSPLGRKRVTLISRCTRWTNACYPNFWTPKMDPATL